MNVTIAPTDTPKAPGTPAWRRQSLVMPPTGGTATTVQNAGRRFFLGTAAAGALAFTGGAAVFAQPLVADVAAPPEPAADPLLAEALRQVLDGLASALDRDDAMRSAMGFHATVNALKIVRVHAQSIDAYQAIPSWVGREVQRRGRGAVVADGLRPACCDWVALFGDVAHRSGAAQALAAPTPELLDRGLDAVLNGLFSPKLLDLACTSFESAGRAMAAFHAKRMAEPAGPLVRPVAWLGWLAPDEAEWAAMLAAYEELTAILDEEGFASGLQAYVMNGQFPNPGFIDCAKLDRAIALVGAVTALACAWAILFPAAAAMCVPYMIVEAFLLILKSVAC